MRSDGLAQFVRGRDGLGEQPVVVFHVPFVPGEIASSVRFRQDAPLLSGHAGGALHLKYE